MEITDPGLHPFSPGGNDFVVPPGVTHLLLEMWGAGGGGGGGGDQGDGGTASGGGGGGGGGYTRALVAVTPGATYTVVVGTGGLGGAATQNGTDGLETYIQDPTGHILAQAPGGKGGNAGAGPLTLAACPSTIAGGGGGAGASLSSLNEAIKRSGGSGTTGNAATSIDGRSSLGTCKILNGNGGAGGDSAAATVLRPGAGNGGNGGSGGSAGSGGAAGYLIINW